jgi:hypothetical protein
MRDAGRLSGFLDVALRKQRGAGATESPQTPPATDNVRLQPVESLLPTEHWVELNPCHIGLSSGRLSPDFLRSLRLRMASEPSLGSGSEYWAKVLLITFCSQEVARFEQKH